MTQTRKDVVTVLVDDHRAVERVFGELESREGTPEHRRALADHVIAELVRHSVAEEQYLYPAARKALPDGDELADHEVSEHSEAEQTMKDLDGLDPTDPRFDELLGTLMSEIRHHVQDEESDLFPRLQAACDEAELVDLGEKIVRAKEIAPTRPHPSAPNTPPANKILGPGAGLVDKMRDKLSGRTT
ncbi:hemerythrin domain-containing protein [Pseudonocardia sp. MH-G8]|uniref:hemerythrin domain-containing protein n=1 Tax=Pseudonocardia sp. MH-G8 TaxID=1854588 RepID=UPI000BA04D6A|nr:hemerythrin domain-containing protein [Pseudonocardia sp. MH-G8]OZM77183.1 hemerythrin [Pseudonocardia sp. MH-G8]